MFYSRHVLDGREQPAQKYIRDLVLRRTHYIHQAHPSANFYTWSNSVPNVGEIICDCDLNMSSEIDRKWIPEFCGLRGPTLQQPTKFQKNLAMRRWVSSDSTFCAAHCSDSEIVDPFSQRWRGTELHRILRGHRRRSPLSNQIKFIEQQRARGASYRLLKH